MTRDRTGEPATDDDGEHRCRNGWLTPTDAAQPKPCLRCRPWLRHRRPPTKPELAAFEARHTRPEETR